jgi:acyl-coenzyme A thioesterase PaaI-like protein
MQIDHQHTRQLQPNSRHCFICGLENPFGLKLRIYQTAPGVIETTYTAPEHFQGYPGVLHGGIVASILDEISGRAHMGDPSEPRFMFTGKLEVKYRKNVPIGNRSRSSAKPASPRARWPKAGLVSMMKMEPCWPKRPTLLINVPEELLDSANLEELGWKVYPE